MAKIEIVHSMNCPKGHGHFYPPKHCPKCGTKLIELTEEEKEAIRESIRGDREANK